MPKALTSPFLAGLLASGLFLFVFGIGLGFVFLFIPTLPLFFIGLGKQSDKLPFSLGISALIIALAAGPAMAVVFLLFLALPCWYMSKYSLHWRVGIAANKTAATIEWFPIGTIILRLTLYGCGLIAFTTLYYALQDVTLPKLLSQNIHTAFADIEADFTDVVDMLAGEFSFLIFPVTLWLWAILLYCHAWFANRLLVRRVMQRRSDFSVQLFTLPGWMFSLLAISALASLIGGESMRFLGKTTMISLMLPYFFLGVSILHKAVATLPSRKIILFFVYFIIVSLFWPALILSGIGLWHQLKTLVIHPKLD